MPYIITSIKQNNKPKNKLTFENKQKG